MRLQEVHEENVKFKVKNSCIVTIF